jgi:hypothetical protein
MNRNVVELVNRTNKDFKFSFDGVGYIVPANGILDVTEDCANHGRKKSVMSYDLETGRAQYQVGIKGIHETFDIGPGKESTDELIDRMSDIEGIPVKINVRGGQVEASAEKDALIY